MREDLLHFIWKYKKISLEEMVTTNRESIFLVDVGTHNLHAGPDFFNAKIRINEQLWAGNVEIHVNSSDWYAHNHEKDANYENVILHVVWNDDMVIYRKDKTQIPTLELKNYVPRSLLNSYQNLFDKRDTKFINCEKEIGEISDFTIDNWFERLYIDRLEQKSMLIGELLTTSKNDWEEVLFKLLLKNFGLKINGDSFLSLARSIDFSVIRKLYKSPLSLESVLFGQSGMLEDGSIVDSYYLSLKEEYGYQKHKFGLNNESVQRPEFFKLRPPNFPTVRLSQFSNLYVKENNLFSKIINTKNLEEVYSLFDVVASSYWDNHFSFGKESRKGLKKLTKPFIDLLLVNTILPVKFSYSRYLGKDVNEEILEIVYAIRKEENNVVSNFELLGLSLKSAGGSQAVLQLHSEYCSKNKCLQCAIGNSLLNGNN